MQRDRSGSGNPVSYRRVDENGDHDDLEDPNRRGVNRFTYLGCLSVTVAVFFLLFLLLVLYVFLQRHKDVQAAAQSSNLKAGTYGNGDVCVIDSITLARPDSPLYPPTISAIGVNCNGTGGGTKPFNYTCGDFVGSNSTCPTLPPEAGLPPGGICIQAFDGRICVGPNGLTQNGTSTGMVDLNGTILVGIPPIIVTQTNNETIISFDPNLVLTNGSLTIPGQGPGIAYFEPNGTITTGTIIAGSPNAIVTNEGNGTYVVDVNPACCDGGANGLKPGSLVYVQQNETFGSANLTAGSSNMIVNNEGNGTIIIDVNASCCDGGAAGLTPGSLVIVLPNGTFGSLPVPAGSTVIGGTNGTVPVANTLTAGTCISIIDSAGNIVIAVNETCTNAGECSCTGLTPGGVVYVLPNGTLTSSPVLPPGYYLGGGNGTNNLPVPTQIVGTPNQTSVTSNGAGTTTISFDPTLVVIPVAAALVVPILGPHGIITLGPGGILLPLIIPTGGFLRGIPGANGTVDPGVGYINGGNGITVVENGPNVTISFNGGNLGNLISDSFCTGGIEYSTGAASQTGNTVTGTGGASWIAQMQPGIIFWTNPNITAAPSFILNVPSSTTLTVYSNQTVASSSYTICYMGVESAQGDLGIGRSLFLNNLFVSGQPFIYTTGTALLTGPLVIGSATTFTQGMVGGVIYWPSVDMQAFITAFVSTTQLEVDSPASAVANLPFIIYYGGMQSYFGDLGVDNLVLTGHNNPNDNNLMTIDGDGLVGQMALGTTPGTTAMINSLGLLAPVQIIGAGCAVVTTGTGQMTINVNSTCLTGGGSGGNLTAVFGTIHQITSTNPAGPTVTLSLPNAVYIGPETTGPFFPNANGLNLFAPAATQGGISWYTNDQYPVIQEIQFGHDQAFKAYGALWNGGGWSVADGNEGIFLESKMNGVLTLKSQTPLVQGTATSFPFTVSVNYPEASTWMNQLSIGSTIATAGTISTGGSSLTTITGTGTNFLAAMVGGTLLFTGPSSTPYSATIVGVASTTSLTLSNAVTANAGTSYRIFYNGVEFGAGTSQYAHIHSNLLLGTQQVAGTSADLAGGLNIFGPSLGTTGMNIYLDDLYPAQSLFSYSYGNHFLAMGARYDTPGSQWLSSQTQNPWRLNQNGNNFNIDYGTTVIPNTKNAVVTWYTQITQTPGAITINVPTTISSTLNVGGNTVLGGNLNINSFTGGKLLASSGTQVVETTSGTLRYSHTTSVGCAFSSGAISRNVDIEMARAGNVVTYTLWPATNSWNAGTGACIFTGIFTVPDPSYLNFHALAAGNDLCTVGRGTLDGANTLHTACLSRSGPVTGTIQIWALTSMANFEALTTYQLPVAFMFSFTANDPFT